MCSCHSILECCVTFSGVKLSIRSFVLFPALAVQSVSKCLKVFFGILVAELLSVYVFQRLSVCILIINQMFGL